jgi:ABC-2 type transport system ATP-binding protein
MHAVANIVDIQGIRKTYDNGHVALNGLSLQVHRGTIFGFLGLNGAGKTTTIRIIAGLSARDSGSLKLFGEEVHPNDISHRYRIGYVLDEPLYFEWMSIGEYLGFVGTMYQLAETDIEQRSTELIEFFDLSDKGSDPIGSFSTGMKKKVSLAAAIIHNPELIILDEPLEGIDALAASAIKETLAVMASHGTTVFITSHVLDTVERLCNEIAVVHQGKNILQCRTDEIRKRVKKDVPTETYASLEELFVDMVSDRVHKKVFSWLGR